MEGVAVIREQDRARNLSTLGHVIIGHFSRHYGLGRSTPFCPNARRLIFVAARKPSETTGWDRMRIRIEWIGGFVQTDPDHSI